MCVADRHAQPSSIGAQSHCLLPTHKHPTGRVGGRERERDSCKRVRRHRKSQRDPGLHQQGLVLRAKQLRRLQENLSSSRGSLAFCLGHKNSQSRHPLRSKTEGRSTWVSSRTALSYSLARRPNSVTVFSFCTERASKLRSMRPCVHVFFCRFISMRSSSSFFLRSPIAAPSVRTPARPSSTYTKYPYVSTNKLHRETKQSKR